MLTRRSLIAFAAFALLAGCSKTGDVDFTITKVFSQANGNPVNSAGGGAVSTYTAHVNLQAEAGDAWGHRDKIKSIDLVGLDAEMTGKNSGGAAGTKGYGHINLTRGAASAVVGSWANQTMEAAPQSISVTLNPASMAIIEDAIRNDGLFDVEFAGSTNNPINFDATVRMHLKMNYKIKVL